MVWLLSSFNPVDSPNPKRSFFELEAERIAELNKYKNARPTLNLSKLIGKLIGMALGTIFTLLIFFGVMLPTTAYSIFAHGYVGMKLWQWFIVPTFHVGPISLLQAGGVMILIRLFTYERTTQDKSEGKTLKEKICHFIGILLIPWYSLLVGWIAHLFM